MCCRPCYAGSNSTWPAEGEIMKRKQRRSLNNRQLISITLVIVLALCILCVFLAVLIGLLTSSSPGKSQEAPTPADPRSAVLTLAYSPEKAELITLLAEAFNSKRQRTPDGRQMAVRLVAMPPDQMVDAALGDHPGFEALNPDASLWLDQLDLRWAELHRDEQSEVAPRRVAASARYAVSPIVIAAWPEVAKELGWGSRPVGWTDLQKRAAEDPDFRWSHASTGYASGMLATLAEFYAGAGKTRGLTEEDVTAQATLDYVQSIEHTVSFYGENEAVAMQQLREKGRDFLHALVVQEALVVQHNASGGDPLVAIYPHEGTLWEDHPLALLDAPHVTDNQRRTFQAFAEFLREPEQQKLVLSHGFRPADLSIPIDTPDSPIKLALGADPKEPQTTLQMPGPSVVQVVQNVWWYTKRPSNIFLVVDTSGSMSGEKLENVRTALKVFVSQIKGTQDRVGMVEFAGSVYNIVPLQVVDDSHRRWLLDEIEQLEAGGDTALIDAVRAAFVRLQRENDADRINAIVAMTDGLENASSTRLSTLRRMIQEQNSTGQARIVIFTIAYGDNADLNTLRALAEVSGGQMRQGDIETIRELYRILSQYF
ncbi:MAG: VWA domain-containing protein [Caldilineae bacterium]|nr:MAG: VWA domain-containing protein [Caldilineae bacterium]